MVIFRIVILWVSGIVGFGALLPATALAILQQRDAAPTAMIAGAMCFICLRLWLTEKYWHH